MANPTTNYGFVLPTATDLVTDLPADFDVALQGVDTRLKALQPGTTTGDLAYSSATANTNTRLGIGTTGQVLTVASGVPSWAAPASGGGMTVISTGTLSSTGVTFSSISGYKNLQLSVSGYIANSGGQRLIVRCNGDTGSNYTGGYLRQRDGVVTAVTYGSSPGQSTSVLSDGEVTPDGSGDASVSFTFWDYAATNGKKVITANAYSLSTYQVPVFSWWAYTGTTGAITSVTIAIPAGSFNAGTYTLYGVK